MNVTLEALNILLLLLPGFLSSIVLNMLVVRKLQDNFAKVVEALVLSFLIYGCTAGIMELQPFSAPEVRSSTVAAAGTQVNPRFLIYTLVVSVALPLVLSLLSTNDLHMRALRRLRITGKTARATTWLDVFTDQKRYVIVNLSGGRRVFGWPMYYSNDPDEGLLYLFDPAWISEDGSYSALDIHGLFLVEKDSIESIEFTKVTAANARPRAKEKHEQGQTVRT